MNKGSRGTSRGTNRGDDHDRALDLRKEGDTRDTRSELEPEICTRCHGAGFDPMCRPRCTACRGTGVQP
jgi:DnaJ-class molecular chaperone